MLDVMIAQLRQDIGGLRREMRDLLRAWSGRLFLRTILTETSEGQGGRNPLMHAVEGHLPTDGSNPASDDAEAVEIAGFLVVPLPKDPALRLGDNSPTFLVPLASRRWRPDGGKRGEVCMYNLAAAQGRLWIRQDGSITADSAAAKDITLNSGSKKVARVDDEVAVLTITGVYNPVSGALTGLQITDGMGNARVMSAASPGPFVLKGKILTGAERVKA